VVRTLGRVGERWTLLIIREALFGVRRFTEFERRLGISRNILSERLVEFGILERQKVVGRGNPQDYRREMGSICSLVSLRCCSGETRGSITNKVRR
jgi:DNA-binding HxlR family transcriptional regulator